MWKWIPLGFFFPDTSRKVFFFLLIEALSSVRESLLFFYMSLSKMNENTRDMGNSREK